MKKNNLLKVSVMIIIGAILIVCNSSVFAANDLTSTLNISTNNTTENTTENTTSTTNTLLTTNTSNSTNTTNNTVNTTKIYNNTSLPSTGIEDSFPVAVLVVILGISAVYAYKKIQDYKNI